MKIAIFIPGLQLEPKEPNLEKYAYRLKKALDNDDKVAANQYEVRMSKEIDKKHGNLELDVATIHQVTALGEEDIYKIYKYDYASLLISDFEKKGPFSKCVSLLWAIVTRTSKFVRPLFRKSGSTTLSSRYQLQALYFLMILFVISLSVLSLLPSVVTLLIDMVPQLKSTMKPLGINWVIGQLNKIGLHTDAVKRFSAGSVAVCTLIYLFFPSLKSTVSILAMEYLCLDSYLRFSVQKPLITGRFDDLLEYIAEQYPDETQLVEVHAYSFGSIVAYDSIFPYGTELSYRIQSRIGLLLTIGSPHDFIRNYYPLYFNDRKKYALAIKNWLNVYSQADILSSNFRTDPLYGDAQFTIVQGGIKPTNIPFEFIHPKVLSWVDTFRLYTLKIHSGYWDSDEDARSCMSNVVAAFREIGV